MEGSLTVSVCCFSWQLEAGIARHIQELSASNNAQEPEDVSTWPNPLLCPAECSPPPCPPQCPSPPVQSILPLMKFLESELQYLNEHLVQENFKR